MGIKEDRGIVRELSLRVPRDVILRRLKMRPEAYHTAGHMRRLFDKAVSVGYNLIAPMAIYLTISIESCTRSMVTFRGTGFQIPSARVAALLKSCPAATLMAATIGSTITEESERLMTRGRMTEAMILDAFGSEAVDEVMNVLCRMLQQAGMRNGLIMTRRFSPGYGDWPLTEQAAIVKELNAEIIGISVNRSQILTPEKSVTAVAGWRSRSKPW